MNRKNPRYIMNKTDNRNSTYRTIIYPLVACNLLHEWWTPMRNSQYRAYRVLDARANHARSVIYPFRTFTISCVACILLHDRHIPSVIPCRVQLVARKNHARNVFISCIACNLLHDQTTHGTLLTPFRHSWFRATSCTLRFKKNPNGQTRVRIFIFTGGLF